jgi:hypothetical protein
VSPTLTLTPRRAASASYRVVVVASFYKAFLNKYFEI